MEFISTSAAFHEVKKQPLRSLEWDLLKVISAFGLVPKFHWFAPAVPGEEVFPTRIFQALEIICSEIIMYVYCRFSLSM